jgi:hypothetical protein
MPRGRIGCARRAMCVGRLKLSIGDRNHLLEGVLAAMLLAHALQSSPENHIFLGEALTPATTSGGL